MDKDVWYQIRNAVRSAERCVPREGRRPQYSDRQIVLMFFISVWFDRPRCFACRRDLIPSWFRPRHLPSYSQFCRRLHTPRVIAMVKHAAHRLGQSDTPISVAYIDGKVLPISRQSGDPDATVGRSGRGWCKGYRLHALGAEDRRIKAIVVRPVNESETRIARDLVPHAPPGCTVLADAAYDSRFLYEAARAQGTRFLAPIKRNAARSRSRTTTARLEGIAFWTNRPEEAAKLYARRTEIERIFSQCSTCGGGLSPLPGWVRRLDRVTLWVTAKVALHNARVTAKERRCAA